MQKASNFIANLSDTLTDQQVEYLSWKVCGFTSVQAATRCSIGINMVTAWKKETAFAEIEAGIRGPLRTQFADELIREEDLKNRRRIQAIDANVLDKVLDGGVAGLSENTMEYLKLIRRAQQPNVRDILGVDQEKQLPTSWDEAVIFLRRNNGKEEEPSDSQGIIEAEYTESSDEPSGS